MRFSCLNARGRLAVAQVVGADEQHEDDVERLPLGGRVDAVAHDHQQRGLAASGRPDQPERFPFRHVERDAMQDFHHSGIAAKAERDIFEGDHGIRHEGASGNDAFAYIWAACLAQQAAGRHVGARHGGGASRAVRASGDLPPLASAASDGQLGMALLPEDAPMSSTDTGKLPRLSGGGKKDKGDAKADAKTTPGTEVASDPDSPNRENEKQISALLDRNYHQAEAFQFNGTPSFVIGRTIYPGVLDRALLEESIAKARAA